MKLFICYAHTDIWQVKQLVEVLQSGGHSLWFDDRLTVGEDWKQQISQNIRDSDTFLYILSPESVASEWCQWEFAQAVKEDKPIIPVLIQANTDIPDTIEKHQYADLSLGMTPESIAKLMGGLTEIAIKIPVAEAPVIEDEPEGIPSRAEQLTKHVFISYSRQDSEIMVSVRNHLRMKNIPVWTDENIVVGSPLWKDSIQNAIENAGCIVVILSPTAKKSIWVKRELDYAEMHSVPIIPVLGKGSEADSIPFATTGMQFADITKFTSEQVMQSIFDGVRPHLGIDTVDKENGVDEDKTKALGRKSRLDNSFWDILFRLLRKGICTPFLGPGLGADIFLPRREMALKWSQDHNFPFAHNSSDLARVAQFLSYELGPFLAKDEIIDGWLKKVQRPDFTDVNNPHVIMSELPIPLYINANYDDFLYDALKFSGKQPNRLYHSEFGWERSDETDNLILSEQQPLLCHLYGYHDEPASLIITEDDYLEFLVKNTKQEIKLPSAVTERLGRTSYLFVGFTVTDWNMRTLFHILSNLGRKGREPHIAVQIEPLKDLNSKEQEDRVREFLRRYFRHRLDSHVDVYIETTQQFLVELRDRWKKEQ